MIHLINNETDIDKYEILINIEYSFNNPFIKYLVFEEDNKIVAYLSFENIYDRYEIDNLFVLKEYRNNKIATKLMDFLVNLALKGSIKNITLEVKKDNIPAINLYKKYDFKEVAIREKYYNGIDGILMKKEM